MGGDSRTRNWKEGSFICVKEKKGTLRSQQLLFWIIKSKNLGFSSSGLELLTYYHEVIQLPVPYWVIFVDFKESVHVTYDIKCTGKVIRDILLLSIREFVVPSHSHPWCWSFVLPLYLINLARELCNLEPQGSALVSSISSSFYFTDISSDHCSFLPLAHLGFGLPSFFLDF